MNGSEGKTAILVDQHPLWLDAVEPVIAKIGVEVVGKSTSARRGLELVEELRPDVLVTGLMMPEGDIDALDLIRRGRESVSGLKAIVLSLYADTDHVDAALEAGAVAYVIKTAHPDDLASAIRQAFTHSVYLPGTGRVAVREVPAVANEAPELTRRELEILQLVAEGLSNAELARRLWVTEQTIKFHLSNVYRKLDVSNRTEASRWAQLHNLLPAAAPKLSVTAA